jgi:DNA-directed RNA polymerase specialized sigma24 family protein
MAIVRRKYKLPREDCEEIVNDTLLAWHRKLLTADGVASNRAFCEAVLRTEAIEWLQRKSVQTGELSAAENLGVDPELEVPDGEREEIADLRELATAVLKPPAHETSVLVADGVARRSVAEHLGLTLRHVKRLRASAQAKLNAASAVLREHARCQMLALTISDLAEGRVEPGSKRWTAARSHLPRCRRCRRDLASMIRSRGDRRQRPDATAAGPQGQRSQQATSTGPTHHLQQSPEMEGPRARETRLKEQRSRQAMRPTLEGIST